MKNIPREKLFDLSSYYYELPPENIAQFPASPRDSSRLLVWDVENEKVLTQNIFRDIVKFFRLGDLLILNDTRVIPARLKGIRKSGGQCEIFLLKEIEFMTWSALVKPARKIHTGDEISINGEKVLIINEQDEGLRTVKFSFTNNYDFMKFLESSGHVPLPPYIKENDSLRENYQTVFARRDGSVAAPTASLHFTPELLEQIKSLGVKIGYVTLHVGLGTFRPVKVSDIRAHDIHSEHCEIPSETARLIHECKERGGRVIASGTTAARTLESFSGQAGIMDTKLFIYPGYKFKIIDALITNFHLPESSLIMLVASFAANKANAFGQEEKILSQLLTIYENAAKNNWRFFSFGDAMMII